MKNKLKNKKKINKKKETNLIKLISIIFLVIIIIFTIIILISFKKENSNNENKETIITSINPENEILQAVIPSKKEITDWRLILVNSKNPLPEDYKIELAYIDKTRQIDKRCIGELQEMLKAMKKEGINNIWVQSAYRDVKYQEELYNKSVKEYLYYGLSKEEAQELTNKYINKPRESEHNLGLAVDFNNVDNDFKNTKAYNWLKTNAKDYGFIMRYPEEKKEITGIEYEPWHWRYVGKEHSYKMEELNMCLEEYIEYLEKN